MNILLTTYQLSIRLIEAYEYLYPYDYDDDMFEDYLECNVDTLLHGKVNEIIEQLTEDFEIESDDDPYQPVVDLIKDLREYETPQDWWIEWYDERKSA